MFLRNRSRCSWGGCFGVVWDWETTMRCLFLCLLWDGGFIKGRCERIRLVRVSRAGISCFDTSHRQSYDVWLPAGNRNRHRKKTEERMAFWEQNHPSLLFISVPASSDIHLRDVSYTLGTTYSLCIVCSLLFHIKRHGFHHHHQPTFVYFGSFGM